MSAMTAVELQQRLSPSTVFSLLASRRDERTLYRRRTPTWQLLGNPQEMCLAMRVAPHPAAQTSDEFTKRDIQNADTEVASLPSNRITLPALDYSPKVERDESKGPSPAETLKMALPTVIELNGLVRTFKQSLPISSVSTYCGGLHVLPAKGGKASSIPSQEILLSAALVAFHQQRLHLSLCHRVAPPRSHSVQQRQPQPTLSHRVAPLRLQSAKQQQQRHPALRSLHHRVAPPFRGRTM